MGFCSVSMVEVCARVVAAYWVPGRWQNAGVICEQLRHEVPQVRSCVLHPAVHGIEASKNRSQYRELLPPDHPLWALPGKAGAFLAKVGAMRAFGNKCALSMVLEDDTVLTNA